MNFKNLKEAIKFAIKQEEMAIKLYKELFNRSTEKKLRDLFLKLTEDEIEHKASLENYSWYQYDSRAKNIVFFDMELSDYNVKDRYKTRTYLEILQEAAKRELFAVQMYTKLADIHKNTPTLYNFFFQMITEEERHKYQLDLIILNHKKDIIKKLKIKEVK